MTLAYAHEKFSAAVRVLATHPGVIKERLKSALVSHVSSVQLKRDVPAGLPGEYQAFWEGVTSGIPVFDEGVLQASVREMSSKEAVDAAKLICQFAYEFRGRLEEQRRNREEA